MAFLFLQTYLTIFFYGSNLKGLPNFILFYFYFLKLPCKDVQITIQSTILMGSRQLEFSLFVRVPFSFTSWDVDTLIQEYIYIYTVFVGVFNKGISHPCLDFLDRYDHFKCSFIETASWVILHRENPLFLLSFPKRICVCTLTLLSVKENLCLYSYSSSVL